MRQEYVDKFSDFSLDGRAHFLLCFGIFPLVQWVLRAIRYGDCQGISFPTHEGSKALITPYMTKHK